MYNIILNTCRAKELGFNIDDHIRINLHIKSDSLMVTFKLNKGGAMLADIVFNSWSIYKCHNSILLQLDKML